MSKLSISAWSRTHEALLEQEIKRLRDRVEYYEGREARGTADGEDFDALELYEALTITLVSMRQPVVRDGTKTVSKSEGYSASRLHGAATNTSMHVALVHAPDIKGLAFVDKFGTRCCTVLEGEIANSLDAQNKINGYDGELPSPCPHLRKV